MRTNLFISFLDYLYEFSPLERALKTGRIYSIAETDLHNVIKRGNILKDVHKRYIMYQLLKATKYLHFGNVIH